MTTAATAAAAAAAAVADATEPPHLFVVDEL